jgi:hypothetical protein
MIQPRPRRPAVAVLGAAALLQVATDRVAAHPGVDGGAAEVGVPLVVVLVAGTSVLAGVLAADGRAARFGPALSRWVARLSGPLLVAVGLLAAAGALASRPLAAGAGLALGATGGLLVLASAHGATATVGAVALHRLLEGVTLAAAAATGSAVGLLGAVVLGCHATAECVAIGGTDGFGRRRAVGAVLFVTVAFLAGTGIGTLGSLSLSSTPRLAVLALVGGLLVVLGTDATRHTDRPVPA